MHETRLTSLMILWLKLLSCIRRYNYLLRHGLKTRGLFRKPGENNLVKACLHALIPVTLRSHLDATISSCNLCDSSLCLFGCAQKLRDMYDREETFDLATEVGGTGESSVHCVASLLKVWRAHAKCLCFIGIEFYVCVCVQLFFRETKVLLFSEAQNEIISELSKQSDEPNVIYLLGQAVALFPKSHQNIMRDLFLFLQK